MNVIVYLIIFCMGITFGSFFSLAVYRIPLKQDIIHKRSYCPNCGHRLSFCDTIPVFSYIFLRGKCRYCKNKIKARYIMLEILSGITFVLFVMSTNLDLFNLDANKLVYIVIGWLYIAGLFIIAGIDKERIEIKNEALLYIIIVEILYIIYLYIVEQANIYRYVICLFLMLIIIAINNIYFHKKAQNNYMLECLVLLLIMLNFTYEMCTMLTLWCSSFAIIFSFLFIRIKNRKVKCVKNDNPPKHNLPIGYYLCVSNICMLIAMNFIIFK